MLKIAGIFIGLSIIAIIPIEALIAWFFPDNPAEKKQLIFISKAPLLKAFTALVITLVSYTALYWMTDFLYYENDIFILLAAALFLGIFLLTNYNSSHKSTFLFFFLLGIYGFLCPENFWLFPLLFVSFTLFFNNQYLAICVSTACLFLSPTLFINTVTLYNGFLGIFLTGLILYNIGPIFMSFAGRDYLLSELIKRRS
jgi:hypothetical protein